MCGSSSSGSFSLSVSSFSFWLSYNESHLVYKMVIILHRMDIKPYNLLSFFHFIVSPISVLKVHCLFIDSVLFTQESYSMPSGVGVVRTEAVRIDKVNGLGSAVFVVPFFTHKATVGSIN